MPEKSESLGREGKGEALTKKAKRFYSSWRGINDSLASKNLISLCPQESGDDEYQGDQSDTEDEVDSDFDIDEGDEPSSDGEAEEPRKKRRIVTKAYKVQGKAWFSWISLIPVLPSSGSCTPHSSPVSYSANFLIRFSSSFSLSLFLGV